MTTHRRDFIRLVGGGVVFAAAVPATAAGASEDPRGAWTHPGAGETDPRRRAIAYALLAPNPHNMQPWMADLRQPGVITLYFDPTRLLPATDPYNRQIVVGGGAFLELLRLAAAEQGHDAQITAFPEGEPQPRLDARPFARVVMAPGGVRDPLFAHALARRTSRVPFKKRAVDPAAAQRIAAAGAFGGVVARQTVEPARVRRLRALVIAAARVEAYTPAAQQESAQRTFIGARDIAAHRYGVSLDGPAIEAAHALGLLTQDKMERPGTWAFNQSLSFLETLAETAQGFVWLSTPGHSRAEQLMAGRAYLRANIQAAAEGLGMHPWSQALQEYPSMADLYRQAHQTLAPEGGVLQMLVRIGYCAPVAPAPRRGLDAQIRKA